MREARFPRCQLRKRSGCQHKRHDIVKEELAECAAMQAHWMYAHVLTSSQVPRALLLPGRKEGTYPAPFDDNLQSK